MPKVRQNLHHYLKDEDNGTSSYATTVHFRDFEKHLIYEIKHAHYVWACLSWLTEPKIIQALADTGADILVQKEEFWAREGEEWKGDPDAPETTEYAEYQLKKLLRGIYNSLDHIHCVGMIRDPHYQRGQMHHKFLVFFNSENRPYAVWTGSYNTTMYNHRSLENALMIQDRKIAAAYAKEFVRIRHIKEPLDWKSEYVDHDAIC